MMGLQTFARGMRSAPTDAEAVLWRQLRAHRFAGHKFKRQQPIGNYILDFVCFEARLVIEVDGGQHLESASDRLRDEWVRSQGFLVLRFWNNEDFQNLEGVLTRVLEALTPSPQPLSHEGRGAIRDTWRLSQKASGSEKKLTSLSNHLPSPPAGEGPRERGNDPKNHRPHPRRRSRLAHGQCRQGLAVVSRQTDGCARADAIPTSSR